jgi:hypothetical protein
MSTYATIGAKMTDISVVTKRDDPNYSQVSGYVPKDLARRFRIACTSQEISQSEALEEALEKWLEDDSPSPDKKSKKN